jgi:hypothetical protein
VTEVVRGMLRRVLPTLLLVLALAPASADAAVSQKKAIWGPNEIDSQSQFPVYKDLGAGIYQTTLNWAEVAAFEPVDAGDVEDPSYDWPLELDTAISEAKHNGIDIALTVTGAPEWANGDKPANYGPAKPADFAAFVAAAAKRYPTVRLWSIWDNPSRTAGLHGASATQYARLLDGAYAKLKAASKNNKVIGGNSTATTATKWIGKLKLPNGKRPRMDMYGHDASAAKPPTAKTLKALETRVTTLGKGLELYLSPVSLTLTPTKLGAWIKSALKVTKADKNVYTFGYRGLIDDSGVPMLYKGLMDANGTKRPGYNAFKRG